MQKACFPLLLVALALAGPALAAPPAGPDALAAVVAQLAAADEPTRLAAAEALRDTTAAELAPFAEKLVNVLEVEPSRLVRAQLAWAIGNTAAAGAPFLARLLAAYRGENAPDVRRNLLRGFGLIQPTSREVVDFLIAELPAPVDGQIALQALGQLGPAARPAVPALTGLLRSENSSIRISAAIAVGDILKASPVSPGGADPLPAAVAALSRSLGDLHLSARQEAAQALGKIGPAAGAAVPALIAVLELGDGDSADTSLHRYAAYALGEMGKLALPAAPALRRCFENDPDLFTRKAAEAALRKLGVAPIGQNLKT